MAAPPTVNTNTRYPPDVHTNAVEEAKRAGWSLNTYTIRAVTAYTTMRQTRRSNTEATTP